MSKLKAILLGLFLIPIISFGQRLDLRVTGVIIDGDTISESYINKYDFQFKIDLDLKVQILTVFNGDELFYSRKELIENVHIENFVLTYQNRDGILHTILVYRENTELVIDEDIIWIGNLKINF